jgi:hypothetical protein
MVSGSAADRLGRRHPQDPDGRVRAGDGPEHDGKPESESDQPAREEEQLLSRPGRTSVDRNPEQDREGRSEEAPAETAPRFAEVLGTRPRARILLEAATESEWVARCLEALGHEVVVADPNFAARAASPLVA